VQLRFQTGLTSEEYVEQKAWESASLERCPHHPEGGCGFSRHTPYERVEPPGTLIARWYCPKSHTTFSLLPDCLAARWSSTLEEVEQVARQVEETTGSFEQVAQQVRPDIELQGAVRWVRRRVMAVALALVTLKGLVPGVLADARPTLQGFREALGAQSVLPCLRGLAGAQVRRVPFPVGLGHRHAGGERGERARQHPTGADPPESPV
jgi:hypothetical protein